MAGFYHSFTSTRLVEPDPTSLFNQLRAFDATVGLRHEVGSSLYVVKKSTDWLATHIITVQNIIDTAPNRSLQLTARSQIDSMSLFEKAFFLTLVDQINVLRTAAGLPTVTPAQAFQAIKNKVDTL